MPHLALSPERYDSEAFKLSLKSAIESLAADTLPLHTFTTQGGLVDDSNITASIMQIDEQENSIHARVGIFFTEIVGGCSCGDDPYSVNAYGELMAVIDKAHTEVNFQTID